MGGRGGAHSETEAQKAFSTALDDDGSRRDTHMLVPAPLVCLVLCRLDELHAPRRPHLPLPRADPHALTPRRAAFVLACDAPLVSRRVERVGLCAVCALVAYIQSSPYFDPTHVCMYALVDASSVSRAHARARRRPAVPL